MQLSDSIEKLSGVGGANAKKLAKLGIFNISDLIRHFPYRYDDLSQVTKIADTRIGDAYTVRAKIQKLQSSLGFRFRKSITQAGIADTSGSLTVVWFNQPYLAKILKVGATYLFSGPISFYRSLQMQNPVWELDKAENVHTGRIVPVYPLTAGIYPKWLRTLLKKVLKALPRIPEILPSRIVQSRDLLSFDQALRAIHFPKSLNELERARRRLAFEELLFFEIKILSHKRGWQKFQARPIAFDEQLTKNFVKALPFKLTSAQKIAAWRIIQDLQKTRPMNRLLTGDVGSGKTVVAALASLQVLHAGQNAALMAPTEILAAQHYKTFLNFPMFAEFEISLLVGSKKRKRERNAKGDKRAKLYIGTHALIQKNVNLGSLGLVVVDEQQRFGVQQRAELQGNANDTNTRELNEFEQTAQSSHLAEKELNPRFESSASELSHSSLLSADRLMPHFVSLTATPIPRTLALTLYGDLDISEISELPTGRKPIKTRLTRPEERNIAYREIEKELAAGRQAFFISPLIDPSDNLGARSATELFALLKSSVFPKRRVGLLHGRLSTKEKDKIVTAFGKGDLDILVATTVVEVGVDFPNATVMAIEGAERYGLAQLHQLRGRVGRSDMQSYCYLLPQNLSEKGKKRLQAMIEHHTGRELAEIDLKLRGPGTACGNLQSGYPQFKIADIFDSELLEQAREEAELLLAGDEIKNSPELRKLLNDARNMVHWE